MLFDFHLANIPALLAAGIPLICNVALLAYAQLRLPRDRTVFLFSILLVLLIGWQGFDVGVRLSRTAETAEMWRGLMRFGQMLTTAAMVHFALVFSERDRVVDHPLFLPVVYGPGFFFQSAYTGGLLPEDLHYWEGFGWLARPQGLPLENAVLLWNTLLSLLGAGIFYWNAWHTRDLEDKGGAARVLAVGATIPIAVGLFTEAVLPLAGYHQIPLTSTALSGVSIAIAIALTRYNLFRVSSQAAAKAVLNALTDSLVIASPQGKLLFVNPQAAAEFGIDPENARAHGLRGLFPDDATWRLFEDDVWERTLRGERIQGVETQLASMQEGQPPTPMLLSTAPIPIARRGRPGVVLLAHDVTRLKDAERELVFAKDEAEEANRSKSLFLANMSHELRTPLNAVIGYAEMLEEEAEDEGWDSMVPDLQRIRKSGVYLLELINDILDLSKIESGKFEVYSEVFALRPVVEETLDQATPLWEKNNNRFELRFAPEVNLVYGDPVRVRQVLLNLISNGAKFCENGDLALDVGVDKGMVTLAVSDSGIGMDAEQVGRLFGLFQQVHKSDHSKYGGTGLGLALSKRLCQMMGGDIHVTSTPGEGSVFTVVLPLTAP